MKNSKVSALCVLAAAALTACGGGGESGGETHPPYNITLRASKNYLPLNVDNVFPGLGTLSPYSTSVYVSANQNGRPIPGGEKIFGCNITNGLDYGSLYYVDWDDDHVVEVDDGNGGKKKIPKAFRSIVLDANTGGDTFIFHAGETAGTSRITCSVTDPRDKKVHSASVDINVGLATGKAATLRGVIREPYYLGAQGNYQHLSTSIVVQAQVFDDANQAVPNSGKRNVQVEIIRENDEGHSRNSRLLLGEMSGSKLQLSTVAGVAQFAVSSGSNGRILLKLTADRADGDVANGISDPITFFTRIDVVPGAGMDPVAIQGGRWGTKMINEGFSFVLPANGGVPPYTWKAQGLPPGLSLTDERVGIIEGSFEKAGDYEMKVTVLDAMRNQASTTYTVTVVEPPPASNNGGNGNISPQSPR